MKNLPKYWKLLNSSLSIALILSLLLLGGCAPKLGEAVRVNQIPEVEIKLLSDFNDGNLRLGVDSFVDSRADPAIAEIEGERKIPPAGDVGAAVQMALKRHLQLSGLRTPTFDSYKLSGEVLDWKVNVKVKFPYSTATANAKIKVYLLDSKDTLLYSGVYSGGAENQNPYIEDHIEETLGAAMGYAIRECLGDQDLVRLLAQPH